MIVKVHQNQHRQTIVAVCDENLLGKNFEEGKRQLDLTCDFYNGTEQSESEIGDLLRNADGVHLVGGKSIQLGLQEGIIDEKSVVRIQEIPFAIILNLHE